ncbi:MAG: COQ9 family protein [Paracoccaceae bacterium]
MNETYDSLNETLLDAALLHVPFDGWSEATFAAAVADSGVDAQAARMACPRGAVDLALTFHARGDVAMVQKMRATDMSQMRYRDKIAAAVRFRLEAVEDKEAVRRGTTLFALPIYASDGAKAIWGTADKIWTALGDSSEDVNWYTKRATLSGVYGATVLFWLGDDSVGHADTWAFLDRRIENVMQFEKVKSQIRKNPVLGRLMAGPDWLMGRVRAPMSPSGSDLPGRWVPPHR